MDGGRLTRVVMGLAGRGGRVAGLCWPARVGEVGGEATSVGVEAVRVGVDAKKGEVVGWDARGVWSPELLERAREAH